MKYIVTVYFYETIKLILFLYFQTQPKRTISRHIPKTMYSLVLDIDMVSKNIFDHNFFLQKNYELQSNVYFYETIFQDESTYFVFIFQTQPKRIYLQSKFEIFDLRQT